VNGSAVDKRLKAMANKSSLPTKAELDALIEVLGTIDDERDRADSLGQVGGIDSMNLAADLVARLERSREEMRTNGEVGPPALTKTIDLLHQQIELEATEASENPEAWIDSLLAGELPGGRRITGETSPVFRSLKMDLLTEDDLRILKEMEEEIRAEKES
jgi:hypothetical protein